MHALIPTVTRTVQTVPVPPDDHSPQNEAILISDWLRLQSSPHTLKAYECDWSQFRAFCPSPVHLVTKTDLLDYRDWLKQRLKPASQQRKLAVVKSLFRYAQQSGYMQYDVGRALKLPANPVHLTERILDESDVQRMLALETNPRNQAILRTLYVAGLRVSELCGLRWRHVQPREKAGQISVWGKGNKDRTVLLTETAWKTLCAIRPSDPGPDTPVFPGQGGPLTANMVLRIVRAAAVRAGITKKVSPHWLRHCHVSHALDNGAPMHHVCATVGHSSITTTQKYMHAKPKDSSSKYIRA